VCWALKINGASKMQKTLFIAFTIIILCSNFPTYAEEKLPPTFLQSLKFNGQTVQGAISQNEITGLMESPVDLGDNKTEGVLLGTLDSKKTLRAINCKDYLAAKHKNMYAVNTFELTIESFFKESCGALSTASLARPSLRSFFRNAPLDNIDVSALPSSMLNHLGYGEDAMCEGTETIEVCLKKHRGNLVITNSIIGYKDDYAVGGYAPLLRGDINNDGNEDLVYAYGFNLTEGTLRSHGVVCLTRLDVKSPISEIECGDFNK
jgi:hypothetical protein